MKLSDFVILTATFLVLHAQANEKEKWSDSFKPFKGEYLVYAGSLSESTQPTKSDRKISVKITGQAARDFFESMYPDEKKTCTDMEGYRERRKGEILCTYFPQDGFSCYIGFDLRTGVSIGGASC